MSNKPILKLIDYDDDCRRTTVVEMLKAAVRDIENAPEDNDYEKAIILFLKTSDNMYETTYSAAGLSRPEVVALLEIMKIKFLRGLLGDEDV